MKGIKYDHIITKAIVGKDEDWKQFVNYNSKVTIYCSFSWMRRFNAFVESISTVF